MIEHKGPHPGEAGIEEPQRERGGRYNMKVLGAGAFTVLLFGTGLYAVAGITTEVDREKPKGLEPAMLTAQAPEARPAKIEESAAAEAPPEAKPEPEKRREREQPATGERQREQRQARQNNQPQGNFKVSTLAFGNKHMGSVIQPLMDGSSMAAQGASGGRDGVARQTVAGTGEDAVGASGGRGGGNAKSDFYTGGGGRSGQGLYHPHSLQPELEGCVLKAGEEIIVQSPNPVRTELPGQVRGVVVEDAWGVMFSGGGQVEECLAVPAGSRTMTEVNSSVSRGDLRVQMCTTRIDLLGGGIMPMECSPVLGQDGAMGAEAETDYQWGGVVTGILLEAALSAAGALGNLIEGPAGVAVNVGTQGMRGVGAEYINRELMRPPVLTMRKGAIYRVQVNSDISFPGE
jgi:type IV secretory pathway VirB10-like protein